MNKDQISKKLSSISIEEIAKLNNFTSRKGGKITPMNFVVSFFLSIQKEQYNLSTWAAQLSLLIRTTISYNGLKKAQDIVKARFAKALLHAVLAKQIAGLDKVNKLKTRLLDPFNRVYLEDSSCISLPAYLHKFFPGAHSSKGLAATAKIQFRQELKSGNYTHIELLSFRNNDQSFSHNILKILQTGDLVIRDLGYAVLDVFAKIDKLNAFYISRFRYGTNLYDSETGELFDLAKRLRKATRNNEAVVELFLHVGASAQLPARICAVKCPPKVIRQKRRAAKKNRSAKANHSKDYIELLGWTIFLTNVAEETLSAQQLLEVYGYRWRIEIIFKCWKSHLNLDKLFNTQAKLTKENVDITLFLCLVWITLFFARMYNFFLHEIYTKKKKILSVLKFAKFVKEHFTELLTNPNSDFWIDHLAYYCSYKKRNDRLNFCEQVYLLI